MARLTKRQQDILPSIQTEELSERDILLEVLKLQTQLNSKIFEFMRGYQEEFDYRRDQYIFRHDIGRSEPRIKRIYSELNAIGYELVNLVEKLTNGNIFGKRDKQGRILLFCNVCKKETAFASVIDAPYGIPGAYMAGSERLVCCICNDDAIYHDDERLPKYNCFFRME